MKNPILTIAIPTYNRPAQIKKQVEILVPQLTDEVLLVVQDNHSDQPVAELFGDNILNKITIIRNKFNIGPDANIAKCVDLCKTPWLLILGDDDPMSDDAVATMVNDIRNAEDKTVFLNYDPKTNIKGRGLDEFLALPEQRYWCLFWMSGCVYNIELLKDSLYAYFGAISTMQPNIVLLVNALEKHSDYGFWITGKNIHREAGPDIGWSRESFVYSSLFVLDLLHQHDDKLNGTLFRTIAGLLYRHIIKIAEREKKTLHSYSLIIAIIKRRGIVNTLKYDIHWLKSCLYHITFGR